MGLDAFLLTSAPTMASGPGALALLGVPRPGGPVTTDALGVLGSSGAGVAAVGATPPLGSGVEEGRAGEGSGPGGGDGGGSSGGGGAGAGAGAGGPAAPAGEDVPPFATSVARGPGDPAPRAVLTVDPLLGVTVEVVPRVYSKKRVRPIAVVDQVFRNISHDNVFPKDMEVRAPPCARRKQWSFVCMCV